MPDSIHEYTYVYIIVFCSIYFLMQRKVKKSKLCKQEFFFKAFILFTLISRMHLIENVHLSVSK